MMDECACESLLVERDGRRSCPRDECEWWVPAGMRYLAHSHFEDVHPELLEQFSAE
jgi:hypothetical protein